MVQFTKLRLHGFKSFVDPTVMEIGSGMTGIVGPNGCGKSNLVEALRWVMGETSAKRMRGSGMEDVIFAGTKKRPARNTADVTLFLDNSDRTAPAELNNSDELEIIRHIEREHGSTYRVNGKTVRARDVQILFADSSIGAHSPAMVSQGRVSDLISAKPTQRRLVLEEAAGISGLHARRHEAEIKLRAAESNLTRAEDIIGTMDIQMQGLKKQSRQASRYRNLSDHIKKAEALVLYLQWQQTDTAVGQAKLAFENSNNAVRDYTIDVTKLTADYTNKSSNLPYLRKTESEAAATLQHLKLNHNMLEKEAQQLNETLDQNNKFLLQVDSDISHEKDGITETQERIKQLNIELESIKPSTEGAETTELEKLTKELETIQTNLEKIENNCSSLTEALDARKIKKQNIIQSLENVQAQSAKLSVRLAHLQHEKIELESNLPDNSEEQELLKKISSKELKISTLKENIDALDKDKLDAEVQVEKAFNILQEKQNDHAKLTTEINTLNQIVEARNRANNAEPIINNISVHNGMEKALAVALGEDAEITEDTDAPIYWTILTELKKQPSLPDGIRPLSEFVTAPKALSRRLALIGVVDTDVEAKNLVETLEAGQCLVTIEGSAWRWDGLVITANAPSASAIHLEQKNRLLTCQSDLPEKDKALNTAQISLSKLRDSRNDISENITTLRSSLRDLENELHRTQQEHSHIAGQNTNAKTRILALDDNIADTENELKLAKNSEQATEKELALIPNDDTEQQELKKLEELLLEKKQVISEKQSQYDRLLGAEDMRKQRILAIEADIESWTERQLKLTEQLDSLMERKEQTLTQKEQLTSRPTKINAELQSLLTQIVEAEKKRNDSADALAKTEKIEQELQQQLKTVELKLADAREARAHAQATVSTAQQTQEMILQQVNEKFSCGINDMLLDVGIDKNEENLPELSSMQTKLERLLHERESMGPVNLRADIETQELIEQIELITTEKDDLISAIGKLRQGISKLNKEARERLLEAFDVVNKHFGELFTRLFDGGSAYLELTNTEDPLEAGLEIYAQPPGKKMQVLSLFSGGEQTLTSIALIFAMFLTNPAPICVLDEIDAPLDDSNVDRVCTLLEQISKETSTRFIVISHHRMTMARMDRLYGVTMSEQGISQLVSVDLQQPSLLDYLVA